MVLNIPTQQVTAIDNFVIRKASEDDVDLIITFIQQLAEYEKMIDEVVVDKETLSSYLFCANPFAHVIIGEYHSKPVGFALFFTNFSTFLGRPGIYLEDLFVKPEFRGHGYGKALLSFLAKITIDNNFGRLEWSVLDWNEPAIKFYESLGAVNMKEWKIFRLASEKIQKVSELPSL